MLQTFKEYLLEKFKTIDLHIALFEDNMFIGAYTSEESFQKQKDFFRNYVEIKGSPFHLQDYPRREIYVVFYEPFDKPYRAEVTLELGDARKIQKELRSKHAYKLIFDKPAKDNYLLKMKDISQIL